MLIVLGGLVIVGGQVIFGGGAPADYAGPGGPEVVVEVHPGDTAEQIGSALTAQDVVASGSAFFNAAVQNEAMNTVQPGFYSLPTQIPAAEAVRGLVDPMSRVGKMIISEGRQLHDATDVQTGATKKGIYTLISEASCLGVGGQQNCISYDDLNAAGAGDLTALGVPEWAKGSVASVPDRDRQLEGLIAAGSWDFDPTSSPTAILERLVSGSSASYAETGILTAGNQVGITPYEMLISASLVEREALPADFSKVARVILNRLAVDQPLQFDSTVNYSLDTTELATTDADRARVTPWNTYASPGLPATPISSPSLDALQAVESPEPGDWIYFVTIDAQGTTLFTKSYEEHLTNIDQAIRNGILNSGR
ncbi:endolytic transglycosylase MltG [Rhodococcus marinonascens]|uniref:endolytic transglycosylase MltG n=1 Tax=Rhodococcus marinonascens TaxID=38311 RepID=UPI0035A24708